ncbi:MAG: PLP-dependent transferase [Dysgonamonadaceae bacterium]
MDKTDCQEESFSTRVIAEQFQKKDTHGAITMPIYRNAAFEFADSVSIANAFQYKEEEPSHTYSRISNPTVENFEKKMKAASGAQQVQAVSSGMAAISNTFMTLIYAGANIVTSPHLFGNTFSFFKFTLANLGVEARMVNTDNPAEIEAAIDENTVAFFCELITNPHMEIADLEKISPILKARNVPMIVDSTIVPWCGFNAPKFGADIEVVSTTKYISGGATSIGGAILDYGTFNWKKNKVLGMFPKTAEMSPFAYRLKREIARNFGACMDSDIAYMQSLGMETLELRFQKVSDSACEIAQFLEAQPEVVRVGYTALASSPYKQVSDKMFTTNPGAMLTFRLQSQEKCYALMDKLNIIRRATNLFDNKTLIIHPYSTIYGTFSKEMKDKMDIKDNELRLSVGLEGVEDLKKDLRQALDSI